MRKIITRRSILLGLGAAATASAFGLREFHRRYGLARFWPWAGKRDLEEAVSKYGPGARARFLPHFKRAGVSYPPAGLMLVALKEERMLEVWARGAADAPAFVCAYPVLGASGHAGPKLREGDCQVPEGVYRIEYLNPNSRYHLSMKINYPSLDDRMQALREGRTGLGGDIFIHGKMASIGCLAMGDTAIEELFVMVAETGKGNIEVLAAPWDFRVKPCGDAGQPDWVMARYKTLTARPGRSEAIGAAGLRGCGGVRYRFRLGSHIYHTRHCACLPKHCSRLPASMILKTAVDAEGFAANQGTKGT